MDSIWDEFVEFILRKTASEESKREELGVTCQGRMAHDPNVITYKQAKMGVMIEDVWSVFILGSIPSCFAHPSYIPPASHSSVQPEGTRNNSSYHNTWNQTKWSNAGPVFQYNSIWTPTLQDLNCLNYHDMTGRMLHTSLLSMLESDPASTIDTTYRTTSKPPTNFTGSSLSNSTDSQNEPGSFFLDLSADNASTPKTMDGRNPTRQKGCNFCKENGASFEFYSSHNMKSFGGSRVICPILRSLRCEICGATGDFAHTKRYCTHNKAKGKRTYNGQYKKGQGDL